jgi:hypothetical protein
VNIPAGDANANGVNAPRILHSQNFTIRECLTQSTQARVFIGTINNINLINENDRQYIGLAQFVVIKQFELSHERKGFKKEMKLLKRIKQLQLANNGGFPVIFSAKISNVLGEIMMSYVGKDIFEHFEIY